MTARRNEQNDSVARKGSRTLQLTLLAGSLLFAGCAGSNSSWTSNNRTSSPSEVGLNDFSQSKVASRDYVNTEATRNQLPDEYLAEARIGLAEIEAALAAARASEIEQDASLREGLAHVSAQRRDAEARERAMLAQAEKVQSQYSAKQNELWTSISSRERSLNSDSEKNAAFIDALRKEAEMAHSEMTSRAWQDYTTAKAQVEKFKSVREATLEEGRAMIEDMHENAKATRSRAQATVSKLRTQAQSVRQQTEARAEELQVQIVSIREQTESEYNRLISRASSMEKDAKARFQETMARANAMTEQGSEEEYDLRINAAQTELRKAEAEYERLRNQAETTLERANAEIERLQAEAEQIAYLGNSNFEHTSSELNSWKKSEQAEISKQRSRAERLEKDARAEFVKAEAQARANAIRETAAHQSELAESTMKKIISEAESEAAKVRSKILEELANRQKQNSVEFAGKTEPAPEQPEDLHTVPEVPKVKPVTPRVEPEHIAQFRSSLARVMNLRSNADALEMAMNATFDESVSRAEAVRAQFMALSSEKLAVAEAMSTQARAQYADLTTQAEAWIVTAKANYDRSTSEADAFRKEMLASASDLRAEATSSRDYALAQAELFRVEANTVKNSGSSELRALEAALDATKRRGNAEFDRLWVEADSVERSNEALFSQINTQIASAERVLEAELAKQDRAIDSALVIAEANYNESMVNADVFARKSDVEINRMAAQNNLDYALASAEIDHLRNLSYSTVLKADATVGRMLATARADREQSEAIAEVASAKLRTDSDMKRAEIMASSRSAEAREEAVRALFDARLVQVNSERIREMTEFYRDDVFMQTNLETSLAQAEAMRSEMNQRFAELKNQQMQLQRSARDNWDVRLANMQQRPRSTPQQPKLELPGELENVQITTVPTDRD